MQLLLKKFIWDHVHLRPRHLRPRHLKPVHLRPHSHDTFSFETTFNWDNRHLRPHSFWTTWFKTTVNWDHHHLRLQLFEITFILRHVNVKLFRFTVDHFLWSTIHFFAGDLKFCSVTIHLKFCKVAPFRVQGWIPPVCKCIRIRGEQWG